MKKINDLKLRDKACPLAVAEGRGSTFFAYLPAVLKNEDRTGWWAVCKIIGDSHTSNSRLFGTSTNLSEDWEDIEMWRLPSTWAHLHLNAAGIAVPCRPTIMLITHIPENRKTHPSQYRLRRNSVFEIFISFICWKFSAIFSFCVLLMGFDNRFEW